MITLLNSYQADFLGLSWRGRLDVHWAWLIAASVVLTWLLIAIFRRLTEGKRLPGEPYRTQLANAQQLLKVQKEGFDEERQLYSKRLTEAQAYLSPLCATINGALGPSYPAKTGIAGIEAVKEFQEWCERLTAELKNVAPDTFANLPANALGQHSARETFKAFVLRTARASGEAGAEALAAKDRTISSLETAVRGRDETINTLRDEVTRLGGLVHSQVARISQLETEIPRLDGAALTAVGRVSKKRD